MKSDKLGDLEQPLDETYTMRVSAQQIGLLAPGN